MRTSTLRVPGADIYYEVRGAGPVLLLVAGGGGDAQAYARLARALEDRYTVVTFDPRGSSRSPLLEEPGEQRIEVYAEDVSLLLKEVGDGPAHVFGSSSGALIGLDLAARHPEQVRTLVAHEPPAVSFLPDAAHWTALLREVHDTQAEQGTGAALRKFAEAVNLPRQFDAAAELPPDTRRMLARVAANMEFFFRHQVRSFSAYVPDIEALRGAPVIVAGGVQGRPYMPYKAAMAVAERLGAELAEFPGDHVGYLAEPLPFAERLHELLTAPPTPRNA
ncbi:putative hydrolase YraK [Sphaerisporangium krabiense]|uniref:Pimeloyl-ACP methyl ester carboxylesterase n=1 Tax=Sphaerisporangium krabiense TaxID=763782 RepID=A0A7W8Z1H2_9ACTN|nr:alpha/beta hydrolase [Sphaerisporangium krabiense]MBB5625640.1 pimeloyl-ACP methyl ester carboxylesterase [Sphaerisporangium krabiense]GII63024.1 putative hydrolase YraK [Sphaerisporangium krabiense]